VAHHDEGRGDPAGELRGGRAEQSALAHRLARGADDGHRRPLGELGEQGDRVAAQGLGVHVDAGCEPPASLDERV
jgi:hypothetical protein